MNNILIAGDSWATGEWNKDRQITHNGLQDYFKSKGFYVKNISKPGGTLEEILERIYNENLNEYDFVFVITTCTNRTVTKKYTNQENFFNLTPFNKDNIIKRHLEVLNNFYEKLNLLDKKIYLLGGLSTIDKNIEYKFKNLEVVIPSIINFLLPKLGKKYEFYFHLGNNYPKIVDRETIIWMYEQNKIWEKISKSTYFIEDRYHPNRHAHRLIFEHILKNIILKDK